MRSNRLQPNSDKTEVLWCITSQRQHQLPTRQLVIDGCYIYPAASVRDLGVFVDCDLSMRTQVRHRGALHHYVDYARYDTQYQRGYVPDAGCRHGAFPALLQ